MDSADVQRLKELNNEFYRANCASFSNTRRGSWPGWERVVRFLPRCARETSVLDVACGNMRFERFLAGNFPEIRFAITCLDSCVELAGEPEGVRFVRCDVVEALMEGRRLAAAEGRFDMAVTFGFMHHVPTETLRRRMLAELVGSVRPGGVVACSLWRFGDDDAMLRRAEATTEEALQVLGVSLDEGDYLLGWDAKPATYRYCHSFTEGEADGLSASVEDAAVLVDRFLSDGRNGKLNEYLVFERR